MKGPDTDLLLCCKFILIQCNWQSKLQISVWLQWFESFNSKSSLTIILQMNNRSIITLFQSCLLLYFNGKWNYKFWQVNCFKMSFNFYPVSVFVLVVTQNPVLIPSWLVSCNVGEGDWVVIIKKINNFVRI